MISKILKRINNSDLSDGSWNNPRYWGAIVKREAPKFGLDAALVAALILHESEGGIACSALWEPNFYQRYIEGKDRARLGGHWPKYTTETEYGDLVERLSRSVSYGHGQIMGQVARENGFAGDYFVELCDPEINIPILCKILVRKFALAAKTLGDAPYDQIERQALLHYNGGANPSYPDKVLEFRLDGSAARVVG